MKAEFICSRISVQIIFDKTPQTRIKYGYLKNTG